MEVRIGQVCPKGFLPVYSTDTEEEARRLVVLTCERHDGGYYPRELFDADGFPKTGEARIQGFIDFGKRLADYHQRLKERNR